MIDHIAFVRVWLKLVVALGCAFALSGNVLADESAAASVVQAESVAESHTDHAAAGGHDEHHETGVPINFKGDLALFSLVTFVLFVFVLKKFAWGPLIQGLDNREASIRRSIAEAEENRRKSVALLADYDQKLKAAEQTVQAMVNEAKRDAERTSQDLISAAQREVGAIRERAREDINLARDAALDELFSAMNHQVLRATEHVLGRALSDDDQDRLVQEAMSAISR